MEKTYDNAVAALMSPLHQSQTPEDIRRASLRRKSTISDLRRYLDRIQLPHNSHLHCRNIVHVTGTKGKGSVAAFCENILRVRDKLTTGLFTSPHLVNIRERIRIDGRPISEEIFGSAYWEIRQRFDTWKQNNDSINDDGLPSLPGYFRMLTLIAVFIFANYTTQGGKKIDVAIFEVGMGGRYDATNIFDHTMRNVVCGVTLIDYDHIRVLGSELSQIAWEKGGIFHTNKEEQSHNNITSRPSTSTVKTDVIKSSLTVGNESLRFFTIIDNTDDVNNILRSCAFREGKGQTLGIVKKGDAVNPSWKIGLPGDHQRINAELAVALSNALIKQITQRDVSSPSSLSNALMQTFWPGRCQSVSKKSNNKIIKYRCDGAHTPQSLATGLEWFRSVSGYNQDLPKPRVLLFNCHHERNPVPLLDMIQAGDQPRDANEAKHSRQLFDRIYFCKADFGRPSALQEASAKSLLVDSGIMEKDGRHIEDKAEIGRTWQDTLAVLWKEIAVLKMRGVSVSEMSCTTNISAKDAITMIEQMDEYDEPEIEVCVTGSLYLVGSVLDAVEWKESAANGKLFNCY